MIVSTGHADAAQLVVDALTGLRVTPHPPPVPTSPVAGPAVLVQTPEQVTVRDLGAGTYTYTVAVLVVAGNTTGTGLLELVDDTVAALAAAGLSTSTTPQLYQPPKTPAALPAVLIQGE